MSLNNTIIRLTERALENKGRAQIVKLSRGLILSAKVKGDLFIFGLAREGGIFPSSQEWDICIRKLPRYIKYISASHGPVKSNKGGRSWIYIEIPLIYPH